MPTPIGATVAVQFSPDDQFAYEVRESDAVGPSFDDCEDAGLDGTLRSAGRVYTWEDVARAALAKLRATPTRWVEIGYGLPHLTTKDVETWELVGRCAHGHAMRREPTNPDHAVDLGCDAELVRYYPDKAPWAAPVDVDKERQDFIDAQDKEREDEDDETEAFDREDDGLTDPQRNQALVAALPEHNGWKAAWEYPGYIAFHRAGSPDVFATPDYHERGEISVEVHDRNGLLTTEHPNIVWPCAGRTPEAFMALMRPVLDAACGGQS